MSVFIGQVQQYLNGSTFTPLPYLSVTPMARLNVMEMR